MIDEIYNWRNAGIAPTVVDSPIPSTPSDNSHTGFYGDSGIQSHSVGEHYPWSIRGIGNDWQAVHLLTGEVSPRYPRVSPNSYRACELFIAIAAKTPTV